MRHLLRRIGFYVVALWASVTLNFLIPRLMPGNPTSMLMARFRGQVQPEALKSLEIQFGISHDPLWIQYIQYLGQLFRGDLGLSITYFPVSVAQIIAQQLPWTLVLLGVSVVISFGLGTLLGAIVAWRRGSLLDASLPPILTFFSAIPYFWLALILLFMLSYTWDLFPLHGGYSLDLTPDGSLEFIMSAVQHAFLPACTIVVSSIAGWLLGMRNAMITCLSEDYVLMAQAKGLSDRRVMLSYAARNAILPNITGFALSLGFVVSGAILTEIVFSYPGIGFALLQAVQNSDYALLQALFLLISVAVLAANFLADLLYVILDPRVRHERG